MSLMIDSSKSDYVSMDYLATREARNKTNTHVAVPHHWFVNNIKKPLDDRKIPYENLQIALSKDEETMFGTLELPEVCVPTMDAQYELFRRTKLNGRDRHHRSSSRLRRSISGMMSTCCGMNTHVDITCGVCFKPSRRSRRLEAGSEARNPDLTQWLRGQPRRLDCSSATVILMEPRSKR
mgnify:CR=1 FL=1